LKGIDISLSTSESFTCTLYWVLSKLIIGLSTFISFSNKTTTDIPDLSCSAGKENDEFWLVHWLKSIELGPASANFSVLVVCYICNKLYSAVFFTYSFL
jgi:hypothetical protein